MKIREGMAHDDYSDPGPYKLPAGAVAYEVAAPTASPARQETPAPSRPAKIKDHKSIHKRRKM
jgi:hypothetical protein